MTALDFILDGLEAELALERELGVRSFEIDRALLAPLTESAAPARRTEPESAASAPPAEPPRAASVRPVPPRPVPPAPRPTAATAAGTTLDFLFLHDRPLAGANAEMMEKIVVAMGRTPETAPVVAAEPVPAAKIRIVLGARALKKWFPGRNAEPGQWFADDAGDVLVSYSPEYFTRFKTVTPSLKKAKQDMWNSLKSVLKRI